VFRRSAKEQIQLIQQIEQLWIDHNHTKRKPQNRGSILLNLNRSKPGRKKSEVTKISNMELFLRAIESSNGFDSSDEELDITQSEPTLSFISRPPQWCIVDKWFTMQINCTDKNINELEALVYNTEGNILYDVLQPEHTNDKEGKKVIVTVDSSRRATFRLKFINGSKGAWLHIGILHTKQPDKCLLKSPPIKVQTNRSKRPRDNRRKPTPIVNSLSPSIVPSFGNFPGRKDRMLLIFGSNFYLWGNSPIVHLKYANSKEAVEIRPPNLIWWSENLMECQLPECNQDIEIKVANYDMVFGDGKILKVLKSIPEEEQSPTSRMELVPPTGTSTPPPTSTTTPAGRIHTSRRSKARSTGPPR